MSSLTESVISRTRDRRNGPARTAESIGGKRKHRDSSDTGDVSKGTTTNHASSSKHHASSSITSPPTIGRGKRFRRWSGSTVNPSEDPVEPAQPLSVDLEGWKKHESYKRTHSFIRDPLGLDPNPPPPLPLPSAVRSNHNGGHARFRPRAYSHRQSKDRVINPPKQVMCPDPLQLEVKIQAYQESHRRHESDGLTKSERIAERYRYGNYDRYYGYREVATDPRYPLIRREWVEGRDCLDVGCNTGQFTLALTKKFQPRIMVGIDIDRKLVRVAKRNVRHYLAEEICQREGFPMSLPILYGPIAAPAVWAGTAKQPSGFPFNVAFLECDYVPREDVPFDHETEEFDTVFALSITKWVHLNHGDAGLKRFFQRAFRHLRPGGLFILEPQEWSSYGHGKKKGKFTADMKATYNSIEFVPEMFEEYLLSADVGFESCEKLDLPSESTVTAGFNRGIFVLKKPARA